MEDVFGKQTQERIRADAANSNQPIGGRIKAIEHEEVSAKEEAINVSDAATKLISHILDFQPGEP